MEHKFKVGDYIQHIRESIASQDATIVKITSTGYIVDWKLRGQQKQSKDFIDINYRLITPLEMLL